MIVRNKTLSFGLVAVALLCSIVPHQPALSQESVQAPTLQEQAAIFEWFDGSGLKTLRSCRWCKSRRVGGAKLQMTSPRTARCSPS